MGWGTEETKTPGTTATGQTTLATVGDMPEHEVPANATKAEPTYDVHGKQITLAEAQKGLQSGKYHHSHFGDDLLKALKAAGGVLGKVAGTVLEGTQGWGGTS